LRAEARDEVWSRRMAVIQARNSVSLVRSGSTLRKLQH